MNRPSYGTAVFRPMSGPIAISGPRAVVLHFDGPVAGLPVRVLEPQLEGFDFFHAVSDVGHAISDAGKAISHAASDVGHTVDHVVHDAEKAVGDATKWVGHAIQHPDQAISEAVTWATHAASDIVSFVGHNIVTFVQLVQLGVSFIPGIGEGLSAVIGGALALAEGKSITDALIAAALSALPGGPIVTMAASIAMEAVGGIIEHKSFADIVGNVVADNIPAGGAIAKSVIHAAAGVVGAATTGHDVGQALVSGVTNAAGAVLGGQIPIPAAISNAVSGAAGKVVSGAVSAVGQTVVDAAGHVISDVAQGKRLDQALAGAAAGALTSAVRDRLPGGQLVNTAAGAAGQILTGVAQGKRLDQAVAGAATGALTGAAASAVQGRLPTLPSGGVVSAATGAASQLLQGKPIDMVALGAARANLAGGEAARTAFDTAMALKHAQNVQRSGINPESLLPPGDAKALKFFHATRVVVAVGLKAPPGISFDALHKAQLKALQGHIHAGAPPVPRPVHGAPLPRLHAGPVARPAAGHPPPPRAGRTGVQALGRPSYAIAALHPAGAHATSPAPSSPPPKQHSSLVVPLAVGGAALAAAGGAAWWVHSHGKGRGRKR